ncbi:pyridoxamine 5'-phosphate oxidase [Pelagibacterales bacterium SAG-MED19]|nr:pyridoxamine 5'-phosphate oxidase [Pelagibacterales bacterium SAG-MED19]
MNEKNSLGLDKCFLDLDNPFELFEKWFEEAKSKEINDPNALALGTANKKGIPSVRMVLLKDFDKNGFVFYTNLNSQKGNEIKENPNATMCFHWKSLLRQIRINGRLKQVDDKIADNYYKTRAYESRIGAWASKQSSILKSREELLNNLENFKKKYNDIKNVPRPDHWSGWNLKPSSIEFWLDGDNRIHERLKYTLNEKNIWIKTLLSP